LVRVNPLSDQSARSKPTAWFCVNFQKNVELMPPVTLIRLPAMNADIEVVFELHA